MAAFSNIFWLPLRLAAVVWIAATLLACRAPQAPQPIMIERCRAVSVASPITLQLATPRAGTLRIMVRERGISLSGSLGADDASAATVSPVDRYGAMTLLAGSHEPHTYTLRIVSRDSADINGEACVSADLLDDRDRATLSAERAFADGGRATQARHWQAAFNDYLAAARAFDAVDRQRAAEARHAMALLAYRRLDRRRDSYALADRALFDFGSRADPGLHSALAELQATIIVESKASKPDTRRERALGLLNVSARFAHQAPHGARELARLLILRGFLEYAAGSSAAATEFFAQAVQACNALRDWECYARARMNGAVIAEETGNNALALQAYADALQVLSPDVAPLLAADIWDNLGRLQGYVGLFSLGEESQRHAIRLYAQLDNCDGVRRTLSTLGSILVRVGSIEDARLYSHLATARECAALLAATSKEEGPGLLHTLRRIDAHKGAESAANFDCDQLPLPATLSAEGEVSIFGALLSMSEGAALEEHRDIAQRCLAAARSYATSPRRQLRLANAIGTRFIESGEPLQAREAFVRALNVADQAALAATHENREVAYAGLAQAALLANRTSEALRYSAHALTLGSARADVGQVVNDLQILALSLRAAGERHRAHQTLRLAVNLIEQVPIDDLDAETRATYLATQHRVFEELADLLIDDALASRSDASSDQIWTAFAVSERGRARSLQYAISQASSNDPGSARVHSAVTYQDLLARIARVAAASDAVQGWSAAVGELEVLATQAEDASAPIHTEELVSELNRLDATVIEYATGRNDMFVFVIEGGDIHVVRLGSRQRISAAAATLYERLHDPEGAGEDVRRAASDLAQLVLWPLTKYVSKKRLIFVADDALHTVPFSVLPWSENPDSPRLLEKAESSIAPSALFMMHRPVARGAPAAAPRFELIGDPIFQAADWRVACSERLGLPDARRSQTRAASDWTESLARLPGSRAEVLGIAQLARIARPTSVISVRLGCMATPNALRDAAATAPQLLHIATHGYVDALRPRLSALALSRDSATSADGGVFGLLDILGTKLTSRLVVLSACDTSRGRLLSGEGVLGPAQAFLQSGAASVLASYWRVDDAAAASFMSSFYKYLLTDRLTVAAALRQAQLAAASAGTAHTWAGFALYGWPDSSL
jgi:CHAT domain-containing protein